MLDRVSAWNLHFKVLPEASLSALYLALFQPFQPKELDFRGQRGYFLEN